MDCTLKIHLQYGTVIQMELTHLFTHNTSIGLKRILEAHEAAFLVIYHKKIQTLLDMSGVKNHVILFFDRHKKYIGFNLCRSQGDNSFVIASQGKYALFLPENEFHKIRDQIMHIESIYDVNIEVA